MKRTLSLVLVLAMVFSAMLGVVSFADTTNETPELEVTHANLEFASAVYLYVAVDYSAFDSADGITLSIKNDVTGETAILNPNPYITAPSAKSVAFKYTQIGARNMGDQLTIQALKDGEPSGEPKTYSILEYALVAQGQGDEKLTNLMKAMLQYGMDAQKAFNHTGATYDLSKDYSFTKLVGAYFEDGSTKVIMGEGATPKTATMAGATDKTPWYNTNREYLGTGKTLSVPYKKGGQVIYAAFDSSLDMRSYTGPVVTQKFSHKAADNKTDVCTFTTADGQSVTNPVSWFGSNLLNADATRTFTYNPGYLEYTTGSKNGLLFTHNGFLTKDMYDYVLANGGKFTVSLTMASNGVNKIFDHIGFRGGSNTTYTYTKTDGSAYEKSISTTQVISWLTPRGLENMGRVYFLDQNAYNTLNQANNNNGTIQNTSGFKMPTNYKIYDLTTTEFVTVDIVIDISHTAKCTNGICKGSTGMCKCYLCMGDSKNNGVIAVDSINVNCPNCVIGGVNLTDAKTPCTTCGGDKLCYTSNIYINGVKVNSTAQTFATGEAYWQLGLGFELQAAAATAGKIQSIVIAPYDVVNMK